MQSDQRTEYPQKKMICHREHAYEMGVCEQNTPAHVPRKKGSGIRQRPSSLAAADQLNKRRRHSRDCILRERALHRRASSLQVRNMKLEKHDRRKIKIMERRPSHFVTEIRMSGRITGRKLLREFDPRRALRRVQIPPINAPRQECQNI